jgi:hypothetical protein
MDRDQTWIGHQIEVMQCELEFLQGLYVYYETLTVEQILHDIHLQMQAKELLLQMWLRKLPVDQSAKTAKKGEGDGSDGDENPDCRLGE